MSRHSFRWGYLAFGMIFLAAVGQWAVWREELLTSRQLSLTAAGVLIVLGLVGIAATLRRGRPDPSPAPAYPDTTDHEPTTTRTTTPEGEPHGQAADPLA